jgi:hypothetical protein
MDTLHIIAAVFNLLGASACIGAWAETGKHHLLAWSAVCAFFFALNVGYLSS